MKQTLKEFAVGVTFGAAFSLLACTVASARSVINPNEPMVVVPGLEVLGASRISTVLHCQRAEGISNWRTLTTDSEFELMEACLLEHT